MKKQVLILSCLLLLFSGCTKAAQEEVPVPEIEIGGKTLSFNKTQTAQVRLHATI